MKQSISTKTGDKGTTRLFSGEEVSKYSDRPEAYGSLDEMSSILGVAYSVSMSAEIQSLIREVQLDLFTLASELSTTEEHLGLLKSRVDDAFLARLDDHCREIENQITMPKGFIIPGGTVAAAHLDHARSVCRRCERCAVKLRDNGDIRNETVLMWLNRLSDYLWLLARLEEGSATVPKGAR